jgi:hypothetical protein
MTLTTFLNQNLRAIVTLMFAFTFCFGFAGGRLDVAAFTGVAGGVIGYWFGVARDGRRADDPTGALAPHNGTNGTPHTHQVGPTKTSVARTRRRPPKAAVRRGAK